MSAEHPPSPAPPPDDAAASDSEPSSAEPAGDSGEPATAKRRTARITPLVHAVRVGAVIVVVALFNTINALKGMSTRTQEYVLGGAVVFVLVVFGVAYWQWTRLAYWFDDDGDLRVTSGVLQRRERRLQLSRLQSVDVVQPLLARVFGMAEVKVEVAGSGDSRITLQYLTIDAAQALRSETLARAAGVRPDAGEAPEEVLVNVPSDVLLKAGLLNTGVWLTLLIELGAIAVVIGTAGLGGLALIVALVLPLFGVFGFFASYFNFTVAASPDGLRTRYGLLGVQAHTVPPGRVASLEFVEPLLWRRFGWVMVRLTVAGADQSDGDSNEGSAGMLLPVGTWPVAIDMVARLLPGVDVSTPVLTGVPERVRRRSPFQWRTLGLGFDDSVVITRRGWLTQRTTVTPHARVQSVRLTQGPWERALALSSVHFDVVPGPVKAVALHRPQEEAAAVLLTELAHMRREAERDASIRWGRRRPKD